MQARLAGWTAVREDGRACRAAAVAALDGAAAVRTAARVAVIAAIVLSALATAATTAIADPTPSPAPASPGPDDAAPIEDRGFDIGIGGWINWGINSWFAELVAWSVKPLLDLLAVTLLATPGLSSDGRVFDLWKATAAIADAGFVLLGTISAIAAMGYQTVQTRYAVKEVLPRLCIAVMAANTSFLLCGKLIELANSVSKALLGSDFDAKRAAASLHLMIINPGQQEIFYILLGLVAVILLVLLLIAWIMRAVLVLLLVVAAPLALACLALPHTDGMARFWWRAFAGLLLIQVAQSLTLVLAVRIVFNQDGHFVLGIMPSGQLVNLVLALCLLIILIRIPGWVSRRIFAQAAGRGSTIGRIVKYALAYKLTAPVLHALHLGRGRHGGRGTGGGRATLPATANRILPPTAAGPAAGHRQPGGTAHAPTNARRPVHAPVRQPTPPHPARPGQGGSRTPISHAAPPVPQTTPVYGYPRETYYARGPAGLAQMYSLRNRNSPGGARHGRAPTPPIVSRPAVPPTPSPRGNSGGRGRPGKANPGAGGERR